MSHGFPANSITFCGIMRPSRVEADVADLEIEGEIPLDLDGALIRVGPDNRFPPKLGDDTINNGDGMLTALYIANGRASFKSRYVRTDRFLAEEREGRSLFGAYRNPFTDDPVVAGVDRGTGNTNVVHHAGRCLVLKEDSLPIEIDPATLDRIGKWTADGTITSPVVTAHPHPDPRTGELLMFGYQARGIGSTDIVFLPVGPDGCVARETWFKAPYPCLMHDFFATERYALFPIGPAITFPEKVKEGAPYYMWDATQPSYIGVLPREGEGQGVRWFQGPARFAMHLVNAWEEGSRLVLQASISSPEDPPVFPPVDGAEGPKDWVNATSKIVNWTIDLGSQSPSMEETTIVSNGCFIDFPRVDARFETTPHRQTWWVRKDFSRPAIPHPWVPASCNVIERFDAATGAFDTYHTNDNWAPGEPVFVPRSNDSPEGDGYVIAPVFRNEGQGNAYLIFDAMKLAEGPLATVHVPFHFRPGFHGNWVSRASLTQE